LSWSESDEIEIEIKPEPLRKYLERLF